MRDFKGKKLVLGLLAALLCFSLTSCDDEGYEEDYDSDTEYSDATESTEGGEPSGEGGNAEDTTQIAYDNFDDNYHVPEGNVMGIAVNQGLSFGIDQETGQSYYMNSFVEKKETTIFVYLNEPETIDYTGGSQSLDIYRNGELILHRTPDTGNMTTDTRLCFSLWADFRDILTEGNYELRATTPNGSAVRNITLRSTPTMRVLAVPMICNYNGNIVESTEAWKTAGNFTAAAYPLSYDDFSYELGRPLDVSGPEYNLCTTDGQYNVWCALSNLQTQAGDYTMILGFSNGFMGEGGNVGGFTYGSPANIINSNMLGVPSTVAHEIAHCYQVGDEYDGGSYNFESNMAPLGFSGAEWYNRSNTITGNKDFIRSGYEYGLRTNGSVISIGQDPFNLREATTWDNSMLPTSFMGGCDGDTNEYWITSAVWEQLYRQFTKSDGGTQAPQEEAQPQGNFCPDCNTSMDVDQCTWWGGCTCCGSYVYLDGPVDSFYCDYCGEESPLNGDNLFIQCPNENCGVAVPYATLMAQSDSASMSQSTSGVAAGEGGTLNLVDIKGKISPTGFSAEPFYTYEGDASYITPMKQGDYRVEMVDSEGNLVNTSTFAPQFYADTNPPTMLDEAPVDLTLKLPDTTAALNLYYGDTLVGTVEVSANLPEITAVTCPAGTLDDEITLSWEAQDGDGDALYYEVWYQDYGENVICLGSNLTQTSLVVDTTTLPGTDENGGYFLIYVTDGVNTTYAFSEDFELTWKAPEFTSPDKYESSYLSTQEICIDLDAYDIQEGWLMDDDQISWLNPEGKEIATGAPLLFFPFELTPGETHTFTCVATNSAGEEISTEISFAIEDNEDALPDTWYKDAVSYTLSAGYILPFDQAETTSVSRYDLARALFMLEAYYNDDIEIPDLDLEALTDLTLDLEPYEPTWAVEMGYMTAQDGKFDPFAPVTEADAMSAFYGIMSTYADFGDLEMEDALVEYEILEDIPENDYQPDAPLTRAKMFYRFFSALWIIE